MPETLTIAKSWCEYTDRWVNHPMVRQRLACHETRSPDRSLTRTMSPRLVAQLRHICTAPALELWDKLSANLYWGMKLLGTALRGTSALPLTLEDMRNAACLTLMIELESFGPLLHKINRPGGFAELTEAEFATGQKHGFIVIDETWYDPGDQIRINPIFCIFL